VISDIGTIPSDQVLISVRVNVSNIPRPILPCSQIIPSLINRPHRQCHPNDGAKLRFRDPPRMVTLPCPHQRSPTRLINVGAYLHQKPSHGFESLSSKAVVVLVPGVNVAIGSAAISPSALQYSAGLQMTLVPPGSNPCRSFPLGFRERSVALPCWRRSRPLLGRGGREGSDVLSHHGGTAAGRAEPQKLVGTL